MRSGDSVFWRGLYRMFWSISWASWVVTGTALRVANATIRVSAPSSSRIFDTIRCARKSMTGGGTATDCASAFARRIAMRVSRSGVEMSAMRPHSKRDRSRSSSRSIAFGGRSLERTICFPSSWMALKVWKNSSCVPSLPVRNWMSSIRSTSMRRYRSRNSSLFWPRIELMNSFVNFSLVAYATRFFGCREITACPIACIRCVFPRPDPP